MRKSYEELETRVIRFAREDVITASGDEPCTLIAICIRLDCPEVLIPCDALCKYVEAPCPLTPCSVECMK